MIVQQGQINTTALGVPDLYIQIVPPQTQYLNGVATNIGGGVGTAAWGPVNSPVTVGSIADYQVIFGPVQNRKYDLGTLIAVAALQGGSNFRCVRVTDGTDQAAQVVVQSNCATFASIWTGSFGSNITVTISAGSQVGTFKAVVAAPGLLPEVFDNIGLALSGNPLWVAIVSAINNGNSAIRGRSRIIVATAGAGTAAPVSATYPLTGGSDGATGVTGVTLLGQDTSPRKGMYALRNTGASVAALADCDDSTTLSTQIAYGRSEGTYMIATGPAGDSIANAISVKASAGIDDPWMKLCFGDWVYWLDNYNGGLQRKVSPQGFFLGQLINLSPQNSTLNKPMQAIAGTEKSAANQVYSYAELQQLGAAGFDVITNPIPRGKVFGARFGHNTSSSAVVHGDNYTRLTNYIAATLNSGMGYVVGEVQTGDLRQEARDTLGSYFDTLQTQKVISTPDNSIAYNVKLDGTNNSDSRAASGYMQADIKVRYGPIVEYFLVNVEGGQSVTIQRVSTQLAA
jgi:hypothetical protein